MLLIASEKSKRSRAVGNVVREMSLSLTIFASPATFLELMGGHSRRLVLLSEKDVSDSVVSALREAEGSADIGVIVAADRHSPKDSKKIGPLEQLAQLDNLEWIDPVFDYDSLSEAARSCRRRMLRVSEEDLEDALRERRFFVQYQPKVERVSSTEWRTREAEALVRWRHPEHGQVGPLEFLPEIEEFGMMGRLTDYVLEEAAAQLVRWKNKGLDLSVCINLASSQLDDEHLAARCVQIVGRFRLPCSSFTFEVLEQSLSAPDAVHLGTLAALRKKGFRLCLDGFRVAAASLSALEQLPFDEVKIHASAIARAQDDHVRLKVLAAIIGLAHNLEMTVCAEGVEDIDTFEFLKTIECDKMQGFLISEAVMPKLLRKVYGPGSETDRVA
ncbi:MAG: EAL domain-containing protein [Woeseiaceae bacterium]|nr:EAL domain-containing protein [Woeseiaceae bacterium]NIP20617.1 EAL domain-containing protein [Woeseiaceae bacterium]NIS89410.1 EAL domain-containing protein [Woeseiaceae bacterium]